MKISLVTPVFPPYLAGIGNVVASEAKELSRLGHKVIVLTPDYGQKEGSQFNFEVIRQKPLFSFGNAAWLKDFPAELNNSDIVHFHYPFLGGVGALLKFKRQYSNIPIVVTYHMDLIGAGWKSVFFKFYTWLTLGKLIKVANKIVVSSFDYANSSFLKESLHKIPEKFIEVPFGVDINKFSVVTEGEKEQLKNKLGIERGDKIVLFVGALDAAHYFKGLKLLFSAFKKQLVTYKLVIVGGGKLLKQYQTFVKKNDLEKQVVFAGRVAEEDLPKYYAAADLFVLPSLDRSEAYGMVVLEAMASGVAPVVSNLPGVRGLVKEDRGETFPVGDERVLHNVIKDLLSDDVKVKKLSQQGLVWVKEKRSLSKEAKDLEAVYKSLAR